MKLMCISNSLPIRHTGNNFMPEVGGIYTSTGFHEYDYAGTKYWYTLKEDVKGWYWNAACFAPLSDIDEPTIHEEIFENITA